MRPRVFPAEDSLGREGFGDAVDASMRPRVFPAEDEVVPQFAYGSMKLQ